MRLYDCHVRLGGVTSSEVPKHDITAAEILILRHLHGDDGVVRIVSKGDTTINQFELRDQLRYKYEVSEHQVGLIVEVLGLDHMNNLPDELDPAAEALYREQVAAKEREEAGKKVEVEAEIQRRVDEEMAKIDANRKEAALQEVINKDDPVILNEAQIAEREQKFIAGREKALADKSARLAAEAKAAGPEAVAKNNKREERNAQARDRERAAVSAA